MLMREQIGFAKRAPDGSQHMTKTIFPRGIWTGLNPGQDPVSGSFSGSMPSASPGTAIAHELHQHTEKLLLCRRKPIE
jgi:hypothetical protein